MFDIIIIKKNLINVLNKDADKSCIEISKITWCGG